MRITAREAEILELLRREPLLAPAEIARRLKTSRAAVAVHLSTLARKGEILGRGYMLRGTTYVAVVGGSNIDIKSRIEGDTVLATSNPGRATVSAGGVGRNIAHNLGKLGTAAKLISVVGDDAEGTRLVRDTAKAGVDVTGVLRGSGASGLYSAVLDRSGELVIGVASMAVLDQLTVKELDDRRAILENAAMIVADCNLGLDGLAFIARLAAEKSLPLLVEPVSVAKAEKLAALLRSGVSLAAITPNLKQVEVLVGRVMRSALDLRQAAAELHGQGVEHVLVGLGAKGCLFSSRGADRAEQVEIPAAPGDVRDVTGAGDSLLAGFAHALLHGRTPLEAAIFGQAAAGMTVGSAKSVSESVTAAAVDARAEEVKRRMAALAGG